MAINKRGIRDGSGSYKGSFRRLVEKKPIGRRKERGEICPFTKEKIPDIKEFEI